MDCSERDRELSKRIATSDNSVFNELYQFGRGALRQFILSEEDREDLLQVVVTETWRTISKYDPKQCTLFCWMAMIARRRAIDIFRAKNTRIGFQYSPKYFDARARTDNQDNGIMLEQIDSYMENSLRPDYAQAVRLHMEGMSSPEIGKKRGMSPDTIKTHIRRGLNQLRKEFALVE